MQGTQCALGGEGRVEARSPLGLREHNTDHMKHGLFSVFILPIFVC